MLYFTIKKGLKTSINLTEINYTCKEKAKEASGMKKTLYKFHSWQVVCAQLPSPGNRHVCLHPSPLPSREGSSEHWRWGWEQDIC